MKGIHMLLLLTQLGLSCALPAAGFTLLGIWLHRSKDWGVWTVWTGLILGMICAVQGFRDSLNAMERMAEPPQKEKPPVSFKEHK